MAGYIHIFRSNAATGTYGIGYPEYQLTYNTGTSSWARVFDEASLEEFLLSNLGLAEDTAGAVMDRARLHGNVTIADVDIPENEAGTMGMRQMPSDN
jgi:hypothetical protein